MSDPVFELAQAEALVARFQILLDGTPSEAVHVRVADDAWTLAEIVGHLIDSAANNHQRFARLRLGDLDDFPGYDAEPWVAAQQYDRCAFSLLKILWGSYNLLVLHLAATMPEQTRSNVWNRETGPLTHGFLVADYYRHLQDHVEHYARRLAEIQALAGTR